MTDLQHISVPLVNPETGEATTIFYRYLRELQRDTKDSGENDSVSITEAQVAALYSQVQDLVYTLDELIQKSASFGKIDALYTQVQDIAYAISELDQLIWSLRASSAKKYKYVPVVGGRYEAAPWNFVNASKIPTIKFPSRPSDGDELIIRNKAKLDGNLKNINGSKFGAIQIDGTAIRFIFFAEADEWFAI